MTRVLLDENVDRKLKRLFDPAFAVTTVREQGWSGRKNGDLLGAAAAEFDVLVTLDRNMQHQQHLPSMTSPSCSSSAGAIRRGP